MTSYRSDKIPSLIKVASAEGEIDNFESRNVLQKVVLRIESRKIE